LAVKLGTGYPIKTHRVRIPAPPMVESSRQTQGGTMDGCEGSELTARPEGHWVHVGKEWVNMALVISTAITKGVDKETLHLHAGFGADDASWSIPLQDAGPVLAYLEAHEAHSHS